MVNDSVDAAVDDDSEFNVDNRWMMNKKYFPPFFLKFMNGFKLGFESISWKISMRMISFQQNCVGWDEI